VQASTFTISVAPEGKELVLFNSLRCSLTDWEEETRTEMPAALLR